MEIAWNQTTRKEWEQLSDRALAPMVQRWNYGAAHAALGGAVQRAVLSDASGPVALCQVLTRRLLRHLPPGLTLALASNGPLWLAPCDRARALTLIRRSLPAKRPRLHLFTLAEPTPSLRLLPLVHPATSARVTLPIRRENLHGKWRNTLKKAEQSGLILGHAQCSPAALSRLLAADARHQKARGYRALPPEFSRAWQNLSPGDLRLFTARKGTALHASALMLRHGNTASYHIAHCSPEGRESGAARLVLWRAFCDLAKAGVRQVDLGVIDTEKAPGLARFKLASGARARRLGPTVLAL